ncbi:hypothetical protein P5673_026459 [Acropora cervicornis]|uniref:Uncharacterized protein n=1 Tax=Acropora cervicornis TaxID=6130 RepID=A0AAD9UWB8_ACRCE|nr:hypothetical protein P5673_026459 [Acropora cervicornis]
MEHCHFSITQLSMNMGKLADSSKQRTRLRSKISSERADLKRTISIHVRLEDIESGHFPWKKDSADRVPIRTKRLLIDKPMDVERHKEELKILQQEMMVFMKFYKDKILPSLEMQQTNLNTLSKVSVEQQVIQGKLALVAEGIAFIMKQITVGIVAFAPVLNYDLTAFREVLLT